MECCLEGWRQWTFGRWWSVNLYGDDSAASRTWFCGLNETGEIKGKEQPST